MYKMLFDYMFSNYVILYVILTLALMANLVATVTVFSDDEVGDQTKPGAVKL